MVRSDMSIAGVAFSLDPKTGYNKCITINAAYGLGEGVVSGLINPDDIIVDKRLLLNNFDPIIEVNIGEKKSKIIYNDNKFENGTKEIENSFLQKKLCMTDVQIKQLSYAVLFLEDHYKK